MFVYGTLLPLIHLKGRLKVEQQSLFNVLHLDVRLQRAEQHVLKILF